MDWVAENAVLPAVASMSLGGSGSYAEDEVLTNLDAAGVLVVVAGGNSDYESCRRSPARSREVLMHHLKTDTQNADIDLFKTNAAKLFHVAFLQYYYWCGSPYFHAVPRT